MSTRRLYLDRAPGEDRGVVMLDGLPERLLIQRLGETPRPGVGEVYRARLARIDRTLGAGFLDLGQGVQALLTLSGPAKVLAEGRAVTVEITGEARRGKLAAARLIDAAAPAGAPGPLEPPPSLADRLQAFAPGEAVTLGGEARDAADAAEAAVLDIEHPLPGGGCLTMEPTRALTAVDVDLGARGGDSRRAARQANLAAIKEAARLLRLKGLGGLVVIDLVGDGHDGAALTEAARLAFAPDGPGVVLGPVTRLGTFQLAIPRRVRPMAERLCDETGTVSAATVALRLLRALEREGRSDGGARLTAWCAPAVAEAAAAYAEALIQRLGPRFALRGDPTRALTQFEVSSS
jgi:Ribonuclease G/E